MMVLWALIKLSEQTAFSLTLEEHLSETRMPLLNTTSTKAAASWPVASAASELRPYCAEISAFADARGVWDICQNLRDGAMPSVGIITDSTLCSWRHSPTSHPISVYEPYNEPGSRVA